MKEVNTPADVPIKTADGVVIVMGMVLYQVHQYDSKLNVGQVIAAGRLGSRSYYKPQVRIRWDTGEEEILGSPARLYRSKVFADRIVKERVREHLERCQESLVEQQKELKELRTKLAGL